MEDVLESMRSAVISIGVVLVLTHRNAVQIDARKNGVGARPAPKFSSNPGKSVQACVSRPTGPAAAEASPPILNLLFSRS